MSDKKRIAKNTLALYVRMIFVMGITLFSSRIVLEKLGVTDYGVYSSVGGVVAMLGFLNGSLSTSTSRFITFELGKGNSQRLRETFSTAFYSHLILALIVILILILCGTWFVKYRLIIPDELKKPALWTFYVSTFSVFISITQVPYTSMIIANEKMGIYAYIGIIDALGRLGVAYAISIAPIDKLIWYALLTAVLQILIAFSYRIYCVHNYSASKITKHFNRSILHNMLRFTSWSLIANITHLLSTQGIIVLINMFFIPAIAAAQAIANQISTAMTQFSSSFTTAINPQIIKLYSAGERKSSQRLNLQTTVLVWDLMLLIGLPLIVCMKPLIHFWLIDVPPLAVIFSQYAVISQILNTFSSTFYIPMIASGELRDNSLACIIIVILEYSLLYILLYAGFNVMWVQYMVIFQSLVFSLFVKPYILYRRIDYNINEMINCYFQCLKSSILPVIICILFAFHIKRDETLIHIIITFIIIMTTVVISSFICMKREIRQKIINFVKKRITNGLTIW